MRKQPDLESLENDLKQLRKVSRTSRVNLHSCLSTAVLGLI